MRFFQLKAPPLELIFPYFAHAEVFESPALDHNKNKLKPRDYVVIKDELESPQGSTSKFFLVVVVFSYSTS